MQVLFPKAVNPLYYVGLILSNCFSLSVFIFFLFIGYQEKRPFTICVCELFLILTLWGIWKSFIFFISVFKKSLSLVIYGEGFEVNGLIGEQSHFIYWKDINNFYLAKENFNSQEKIVFQWKNPRSEFWKPKRSKNRDYDGELPFYEYNNLKGQNLVDYLNNIKNSNL